MKMKSDREERKKGCEALCIFFSVFLHLSKTMKKFWLLKFDWRHLSSKVKLSLTLIYIVYSFVYNLVVQRLRFVCLYYVIKLDK